MYILFPAVLAIWGIIFYRIADTLEGSDFNIEDTKVSEKEIAVEGTVADTIKLLANYRDPFLDKTAVSDEPTYRRVASSAVAVSTIPPPIPPMGPPPIVWPAIEYLGIINNKQTGSTIALIRMGDRQYFLKEKEMAGEVHLEQILKDSVKVTFQKESKFIKKQ